MVDFDTQVYSERLKQDLTLFNRWQILIATLGDVDETADLLEVVEKILAFDIHESTMLRIANDYWFPSTHWVTVAFARLAETASLSNTETVLPRGQKSAELHFDEWPNAAFKFVPAPLASGGFYLEETAQELRVLYWDIVHKRFYLDTQQFAKLVQTEAVQLAGVQALAIFQKRLIAIAEQLASEEFSIDLPGLAAQHQRDLVMIERELPSVVLDSLFVTAAKQQFVLKRAQGQQIGVEIAVGEIAIRLTQIFNDSGHQQWVYAIIDDNQQVTIFTLLQQLPFFYQWYIAHIDQVGLKDKREVFVE